MPTASTILIVITALFAWAFLARALLDNPRGCVVMGAAYWLVRLYARVVHRLRVEGRENIPPRDCGPLIVVSNHTAGVDPALIAAACPFEVRWMMAKDMMLPRYSWFWEWMRVIGVDRSGRHDMTSAREALRHLSASGVVGVFPEGGIENPPGVLRPFVAGVGLLAAKSGAPVLPILIEGTPFSPRAWGSLWMCSRSRLTVGPMMHFESSERPDAITSKIQDWYSRVSGWKVSQAPRPGAAGT